jgi:hypothetical protein
MNLQLLFVLLTLALLLGAAALFVVIMFRKDRRATDLALAVLLLALAVGVWWTSIRTPLPLP